MMRLEGRAERGKRLVGAVPFRKWRTSTFIAGLRQAGMTAPAVFEGAINGEMFLAYIQQNLAPTLPQGDVVIMDNLASHDVAGVQEAIKRKGALLLYLPA
jgi:transposase